MDKVDKHLPTATDLDNILGGIGLIPGDSKLQWRYLYDETGQRLVEVSDGEGFTAHMSEELFNRLGLNEKAKMKG